MDTNTPNKDSILGMFNTVAQQLMTMNAPLQFGLAQSPDEREKVYRLRYEVVIEKGWMTPEQLPDGIEKDEYDDEAVHLAVWDGDILAATTRLVFPSEKRLLPTEVAFDLRFEPIGRVVDVGRTIIARPYRDAYRHTLLQGVIGQVWTEVSGHGFSDICAVLTTGMIDRYHSVGIEVKPVGAAKSYWGEQRFPCQLDLIQTAQATMQRFGLA